MSSALDQYARQVEFFNQVNNLISQGLLAICSGSTCYSGAQYYGPIEELQEGSLRGVIGWGPIDDFNKAYPNFQIKVRAGFHDTDAEDALKTANGLRRDGLKTVLKPGFGIDEKTGIGSASFKIDLYFFIEAGAYWDIPQSMESGVKGGIIGAPVSGGVMRQHERDLGL